MTPNQQFIVTASTSLLLRLWDASNGMMIRSWKAHEAPVLAMECDASSTLMATGSADSTIKVWDIEKGFCTHNLKGHSGIISCLSFHPDAQRLLLASGSDDSKVKIWDLYAKKALQTLEGHVSTVRGLGFSEDGETLITGGRDQVLLVWNWETKSLLKTIPIYESIEGLLVVQKNDELVVVTGGESGALKLWDMESSECTDVMKPNGSYIISSLIRSETTNEMAAVTSDHNMLFHSLSEENKIISTRQIAGYNDEILDSIFVGDNDEQIAIVSNTDHLRIYDLDGIFCSLLYGHSDMIMNVCKSHDNQFLLSGSKDKSAILWALSEGSYKYVAKCTGHAETVSCVAFSKKSNSFILTGSQDLTIKLWDLTGNQDGMTVKTRFTVKAHDKDIQSLTVAPNDRIFASAGLDKTAKVFHYY